MPKGRVTYGWTAGGSKDIVHEEFIASGGFGEVHKMKNVKTDEVFARKLIRLFGGITREDIDNEANAISQLCRPGMSPCVVAVLKHGWMPRHPSYYFIDMEYCEESLEEYIERTKTYSLIVQDKNYGDGLDEIRGLNLGVNSRIALEVTFGLFHIHRNGIVHRDLKPRNILYSGKEHCWKITDFGTASEATSKKMNTTRYSRGTSSYRAPEVLHDDAKFNNRADIWALGCILYESCTGIRLFPNDFTVLQYSLTEKIDFPVKWPSIPDPDITTLGQEDPKPQDTIDAIKYNHLHRLVFSSLQISPSSRPSSRAILESLMPNIGSASEWGQESWPITEISLLLTNLMLYKQTTAMIARVMMKSTEEVERFCQTNAERIAGIDVGFVFLHASIHWRWLNTLYKALYDQ